MTITAGAYTATYNSNSLGDTQDGWRHEVTGHRKDVTVDRFGDMPIDGVYRGVSSFVEAVLKDWDAAGFNALWWPYNGTPGVAGVVGRLEVGSQLALSLVLSALSGTPAATTGPASATFALSILDAEFARNVNYNSEDRSMPVRIRNYVNTSNGVLFAFS